MSLLDQLNPPQREAAQHVDGPLLILAGAGSGKTRVITTRIAWLILEAGVMPEEILAVTFTNKAAQEMRERVDQILDAAGAGSKAHRVTISTFHSLCARLLRRHAPRLGLDWNFHIYDTDDQRRLIKQVMEAQGMGRDRGETRRLQHYLDRMKNQGLTPTQAHEQAVGRIAEDDAFFYEAYQQALREANCVDFGDLILGVLEVFRDDARLARGYSRRWRYLMVDEFQDTNPAQYELLSHLTAAHDNLCVVGDDDQAIYRWRGATVANILGFEKDHAGTEVVKLEQNYRSTATVLAAANDVIRHNPTRRDKTLWTDRGTGEPITLFTGRDDREEAAWVAESIHAQVRAGADYADFAIFYRMNAQSRQFEEQLQNHGIPYQIIGGVSFYERAEIKDVLAYLRVALNPDDDVSLLRVINTPSRGIGEVTLDKLQRAARVAGVGTVYRAARYAAGMVERVGVDDAPIEPEPADADDQAALDELDGLRGPTSSGVADFCELMVALRDEIAADEGLSHLVRLLIDRTNYMDWLQSRDAESAEDRQRNVLELLGAMDQFEKDLDGDMPPGLDVEGVADDLDADGILVDSRVSRLLQAFLDRSALVQSTDQMHEQGAVTLMTVHGAKGLEFPTVYLVGMEDEIFPSLRDGEDPEELHEERRLAYVAITRAQDKLFITNARQRRLYGQIRRTEPSRFLLDIEPKLIAIDARSDSKKIDYRPPARNADRRGGYDAFRQATMDTFFGGGVDENLWEYDQSPPMIRDSVKKTLAARGQKATSDDEPLADFDASFSQDPGWDDSYSQDPADWADPSLVEPATEEGLVGCTVSHSRFGVGQVTAVSGSGDKAILTVDFPSAGEKKIVRKWVKILG